MRTLGLVTIGQAPRTDVVADVADDLAQVRYVEHGALDGLDPVAIEAVGPELGEPPLVSRLRDGTSAQLGHRRIAPLVERAVRRCADDGADAVLLLCTGWFDGLDWALPVFAAEEVAGRQLHTLVGQDAVGVVVPLPGQLAQAADVWADRLGRQVDVAAADPYQRAVEVVPPVVAELARRGAEWVYLDCIGYPSAAATAAQRSSGVPVIAARTLAVRGAVAALLAA